MRAFSIKDAGTLYDAGGEPVGEAKPLLHLAQRQNAAIRRQQAAIELDHDRLPARPGDRPGNGNIGSFMAGVASLKSRELASITRFYVISDI